MRNNLLDLQKYIRSIDSDIQHSVHFMDCDNKFDNMYEFLRQTVIRYDLPSFYYNNQDTAASLNVRGLDRVDKRVREIYDFLNHHWQDYTWSLHDVHFHTCFRDYVSCPYTCANELDECLEKILKEKFCA